MFRIIGVTVTVSGIILLISFPYQIIGGITFFLVGMTLVFLRRGIVLDFERKKFKEYFGLLFIKLGKWNNLSGYMNISVLMMNIKSTGFSSTGLKFTEKTRYIASISWTILTEKITYNGFRKNGKCNI
ncbi:hypothetical protein [Maribacter sp. LLG6340-A2]|uniref:hypothetical protein n=1 Tax=Maribacter sp. LLG6340-A2 TaxID=3160834 RepID=UPI0038670DA2